MSFPPFRVDVAEERLWKGTRLLTLRRKPFAILAHLVANPGRLVTHDELLEHVWRGTVVSESALRSHLHELRQVLGEGVIETVIGRGYRFVAPLVGEGAAAPSAPVAAVEPDRVVVGRAPELAVLDAALERALAGQRQLCFVTGEPGIGKTTLVDMFLASLEARKIPAVRGHCIEQYGTPESYLAVIEVFGKLAQGERGADAVAALVRHAPSFLAQVPHLVPDARRDEVERRATGGGESRMMREVIEALEALCIAQPLVVVLEDLQWSDVATIDLLSLLGQRRERAKLMVIATSRRAEAQTVTHPLNRVMRSLVLRAGAVAVPVGRIERADVRRIVEHRLPGHGLPDAFLEVVDRITAGTPLFLVSFLDDLVARGMIASTDGAWRLTAPLDEIAAHRPETVRQLIDVQLDRLTAPEQRILEAASVVGPEFTTGLVAAALEQPVEQVDDACDALARRGLFLLREGDEEWPDGTLHIRFRVSHGLVSEVCFDRGAPSRRQRWHRLIAERLEAGYGDRAAEISHVLAQHFEQGRVNARAMHYYVVAGERTVLRFSNSDAARLFRRAFALLQRTPETPERDVVELRILVGISQSSVLSGDPSIHEPITVFERTIEVARRLGDMPQVYSAMVNLCFRCSTLADYDRAKAIADELDELGRTHEISSELRVFADSARAMYEMWRGELASGVPRLERLSDPSMASTGAMGILGATDRVALMLIFLGTLRWVGGGLDQSVADLRLAIDHSIATGDPYALGAAHCSLARLHFWRKEPPATIAAAAERALAIPEANVWHAQATLLVAAARSQQAPLDDAGLDEVIRVFRGRTTPFPMGKTALGLPVIEVMRRSGHGDRAAALVDELLAFLRDCGEHILEAEYVRLRGELIEGADPDAAAAAYTEAIALARGRGAHALELRAAIRLARVSRGPAARDALAAALAAITGGDALTEVLEARRALADLG